MATYYSLTPSATTVTEGNQVTFTITRSGDRPAEYVYFSTLSGTASYSSGDYATTSGGNPSNILVYFAANQTSASVPINILNDGQSDSGQYFNAIVQRYSTDPVSTYLAQSSYVTINDAASTFTLSPASTSVTEGGNVTFTISRSSSVSSETVYFSTVQNQGSSNNNDYNGQDTVGVTFAAGQSSRTVTVSTINDSTPENSETFGAIIENASGTVLDSSTFTIIDNDTASTFTLSPASTSVTEGGNITFTISRSSSVNSETVYFSTLQNQGSSNNNDYNGWDTSPITFAAGQSSRTVTVSTINDSTPENSETFGAIIENASGTVLDSSTFTIIDNDAASTFTLSPASTSVTEGGSITFTISRSSSVNSETVYFSTVQNQGSSNNNDYNGQDTVGVTFAAGQSSRTVTVSTINDSTPENSETFGAIIENASGTVLDSSTFTIIDNDAASTFTLSPATTSVSEGAGTVSFTLSRSNSTNAETVYVSTVQSEGSANRSDYHGLDTVAYTFAAGVSSIPVSIQLIDDLSPENNETFAVWVQRNADDPYGVYADSSTFTIVDDDGAASSTSYALSASQTNVSEGNTTITFTVTRSGGSYAAGTIYYSTLFGTASSQDRDYDGAVSLPVTFAQGAHTATFTIDINEDAKVENDEYFDVMIGLDPGDGRADALAVSRITIQNDDSSAGLTPPPVATTGSSSTTATNLGSMGSGTNIYLYDPSSGGSSSFNATTSSPLTVTTSLLNQPNYTNTTTISPTNGVAHIDLGTAGSTQPVIIRVESSSSSDFLDFMKLFAGELSTSISSHGFDTETVFHTIYDILFNNIDDSIIISTFFEKVNGKIIPKDVLALHNFLEGQNFAGVTGLVGYAFDAVAAHKRIEEAQDPVAQGFAEFTDLLLKGMGLFTSVVAAGSGVGIPLSAALSISTVYYSIFGAEALREQIYDIAHNFMNDPHQSAQTFAMALPQAVSTSAQHFLSWDQFDAEYYAANHPEAVDAVNNGMASSLFAYYVKWGVVSGHKFAANLDPITPALVDIDIASFDPAAFGSPAIFTTNLGFFAGDKLSTEEKALADHINSHRTAGATLVVDDELSALANRIARDWTSNNPANTLVAQDGGDPTQWAQELSTGEDFRTALAGLNWSNLALDSSVRIAAVVSGATTATEVYQLFTATSAGAALLSDGSLRSIGVGEFGGLWIITLDNATYQNDAVVDSNPVHVYEFGTENAEVVFAGAGQGIAYLGDGADTYFGGRFGDTVHGDAGNDRLLGAEGSDALFGDAGSDALYGGAGSDRLDGGDYIDLTAPESQIFRLYGAALDRAPDVGGFHNWVTAMAGGMSLQAITGAFITSQEFQLRYGELSNPEFVTQLYNNVLDRDPDPEGLANWSSFLDNNILTREGVVSGFAESQEFIGNTDFAAAAFADSVLYDEHLGQVYRLYGAVLGRTPDEGGYTHWTDALDNGASLQDITSGFVNSAEFQSTYGALGNSDFIIQLYHNVLDRDPDPEGLANWTAFLDNNIMTREGVIDGFAESAEYRGNTADALDAYMQNLSFWHNTLDGGIGDDAMLGGRGSDTFVWDAADAGSDAVYGLQSWDWLEFDNFGYADAAAALNHFSDVNGEAVFSDQGVTVTFNGTSLAEIESGMLIV